MKGESYDIGLLQKQYVQWHILLHINNQIDIFQFHGSLGFALISSRGDKNSHSLEWTQLSSIDIWSNLLSIEHIFMLMSPLCTTSWFHYK